MKINKTISLTLVSIITLLFSLSAHSSDLKTGEKAPLFKLKTQDEKEFSLDSQKGKWTVLYFYPKAGTPGCTAQACGFRDNIKKITDQGAEVYGISVNSVKDQAAFAKEHNINFTLLADDKGEVTKMYGSKMPLLNISKRWTFIIDPDLVIRDVAKDVDPVLDAKRVADKIIELKK